MCATYTRSAASYKSGSKGFKFNSKIYSHLTVKEALIRTQHDKCFLCESKITHISFGDVEHFRPKAGYRQSASDSLHRPGYYWLAYDWKNLFLACQLCNQLFKRNLFPLSEPSARAMSHHDRLDQENALFIDPSRDDPEQYISFRDNIPYPIGNNAKGEATISGLGLKREKLNERRLEVYRRLQSLYFVAHMNPPIPESGRAMKLLAEAMQDSAEYAGMTRAAIAAEFRLIS